VCVSELSSVVLSGVHKWLINPISNPYAVYSPTPPNRDNM
jgi:hypothetical protein